MSTEKDPNITVSTGDAENSEKSREEGNRGAARVGDSGLGIETQTKQSQPSQREIEQQEEAKLKAKYPAAVRPMGGHSAFLQKRLAKGQKYFDSGDYQMAKQKAAALPKSRVPAMLSQPTGDAIPTPESVPVRKTSIIQQSKLATSLT